MARVYEHLPAGVTRIVLKEPRGLELISSGNCVILATRPCIKDFEGLCCLGKGICQDCGCSHSRCGTDENPVCYAK